MKRRVTIARALINQPDLLLLDEPTTGLDPQARHLLWDRLYRLKPQGVTLILTTHYMDEAEQLCDRLVVMDKARIVAEGSPRGAHRAVRDPRGRWSCASRWTTGRAWRSSSKGSPTASRRCPTGCCSTPTTVRRRSSRCMTRGLRPEAVLVRRARWRTCSCGSRAGRSSNEPRGDDAPRRRRPWRLATHPGHAPALRDARAGVPPAGLPAVVARLAVQHASCRRCCSWRRSAWGSAPSSTGRQRDGRGGRDLPGVPGARSAGRERDADRARASRPTRSWPGLTWLRTFGAMVTTPLRPFDVVMGTLWFITLRLLLVSSVFVLVAMAFGAVDLLRGIAMIPAALLTGLAFAGADHGLLCDPEERRQLRGAVPVRDHAAVPVLRHVLPGRPSCRRSSSPSRT